jgi:hypothetical protein
VCYVAGYSYLKEYTRSLWCRTARSFCFWSVADSGCGAGAGAGLDYWLLVRCVYNI